MDFSANCSEIVRKQLNGGFLYRILPDIYLPDLFRIVRDEQVSKETVVLRQCERLYKILYLFTVANLRYQLRLDLFISL